MVNQILCQRMFCCKEIQFPFQQSLRQTYTATKLLEVLTTNAYELDDGKCMYPVTRLGPCIKGARNVVFFSPDIGSDALRVSVLESDHHFPPSDDVDTFLRRQAP